ncbi:LytR/AlgR family response regulator transcription factor [Mucilaginibacter sp. X4EP1]|uniref:LytR/AlgR family response regulator transcription factor n=1 Tax=Mucilaginibacter sp. X4EP1 TaxID=2723092 RepID=UPI0021694A73|nr:LytTR family DNA-binding domain-containing protein [Mucilaginibacter sp. X4EP1]MCS3813595.1 DNA-binding LytR/AlgR family response regulator [Mucilaginibacter sp. X4EP1]
MYTCYVIDDEFHAIDTLTGYINKFPGLNLVGSNVNPLVAIDEITNMPQVDIVFLDVDMPELSGLDVADIISSRSAVIFTTAYPNYAVQAFEKNGSDFILKPISFERFTKSVTKVQNLLKPKKSIENQALNEHFFINPGVKGRMIQLSYADILYVEGLKNYVVIYTVDNKYITYLSLKEIENSIPSNKFIRIHKSYIVNIDRIKSIDGNIVLLSNSIELPIGISFKDSFLNIVNTKTLRSGRG